MINRRRSISVSYKISHVYRIYHLLSLIFYTQAKPKHDLILYSNYILPLSVIPKFYIKYLTMSRVHMNAGAVSKLLHGCAYVQEIIHKLSLWIIFLYTGTNPTITYGCVSGNIIFSEYGITGACQYHFE